MTHAGECIEDAPAARDPARAPHRVALRALLLGACGGVPAGLAMMLGVSLAEGSSRGDSLLICFLIGALWTTLLAGWEQLIAPRPPWARPPLLALAGALSPLLVGCVYVGIDAFLVRGGPVPAWAAVAELLADLVEQLGRPWTHVYVIAALAPFVLLGSTRLGLRGAGPAARRWQLLAAAVGGLVSTLAFAFKTTNVLSVGGVLCFTGGPVVACLGLWVGEAAERALLRRLAQPAD